MEITSINSKLLARMFLAGAKNLDSKKDWINELNVFPVPDGDTGTNMTMTIMSAAKEVSCLNRLLACLTKNSDIYLIVFLYNLAEASEKL